MNQGPDRPIASTTVPPTAEDRGMRAALFPNRKQAAAQRSVASAALLFAAAAIMAACVFARIAPVSSGAAPASGEPLVRAIAGGPRNTTTIAEPLISPLPTTKPTTARSETEPGDASSPPPSTLPAPAEGTTPTLAPEAQTEPGSGLLGAVLGSAAAHAQVQVETTPAAESAPPLEPTPAITEVLQALVAVPLTIQPEAPAPPPTPEPAPMPEPAGDLAADLAANLVADGVERELRVPVLMYHYLSVPPAGADIYRRDLSVAPDLFAAHLDRLAAEGFTTISPYQFAAALLTGAALPEKPLLITFDDGYRDNYENALPLLRERGAIATFFVVTDFLDEERPEYLTWEMAREMLAAGMAIESHGRNHVTLLGRDDDYLIWQALGSLETIQYELGVRPRFVSWPAGEYNANTLAIFQSAGYWAGFTTAQGAGHDSLQPFELPRVRVRGTTSPDELIRLLSLDW